MGVFEHFPYSNHHNMNMDWVLQTVEADKAAVDQNSAELAQVKADYEKRADLTNKRKLTESGNFTGDIDGKPSASVVAELADNKAAISWLTDTINSGATPGVFIDCGGFGDSGPYDIYDGGTF